jgi:hypothetical protein
VADSGFVIDGVEYPIPELESFDMDELQVMYDYCGFAREDLLSADPQASEDDMAEHRAEVERKLRHPGVWRTMLHVAYRRANPQEKDSRIRELTGKVNLYDALGGLEAAEEENPTEINSPSQPSSGSDSRQPSKSGDSGWPSPSASDQPDRPLASTGTSVSAT